MVALIAASHRKYWHGHLHDIMNREEMVKLWSAQYYHA